MYSTILSGGSLSIFPPLIYFLSFPDPLRKCQYFPWWVISVRQSLLTSLVVCCAAAKSAIVVKGIVALPPRIGENYCLDSYLAYGATGHPLILLVLSVADEEHH